MSGYSYTDPTGGKISVSRIIDGRVRVFVRDSDFGGASVDLPAAERQAAAQALAGDEWRVVSAKQPGPPEPIDPADVKVGDVVAVEADDGSWLVRGEVQTTDERGTDYPLRVIIDHNESGSIWPCVPGNTVRLVRRAEPEPDPEQVEALADILIGIVTEDDDPRSLARHLVRRGVTVRKDT